MATMPQLTLLSKATRLHWFMGKMGAQSSPAGVNLQQK